MNYKHIYHAGNFADVAKHVGLMYCLGALKRKDSAIFVLDSHAGRGFYDMQAPEVQKSGEAERGIQRLIETSIDETLLADYFASIRARRGKRLPRYPGSPALIAGALRLQDRALFVELMPAEARAAERGSRVRRQSSDRNRRRLRRAQGLSAAGRAPRAGTDRSALRESGRIEAHAAGIRRSVSPLAGAAYT